MTPPSPLNRRSTLASTARTVSALLVLGAAPGCQLLIGYSASTASDASEVDGSAADGNQGLTDGVTTGDAPVTPRDAPVTPRDATVGETSNDGSLLVDSGVTTDDAIAPVTEDWSCTNGIDDGDETGIDCGGSCPACGVTAFYRSIGTKTGPLFNAGSASGNAGGKIVTFTAALPSNVGTGDQLSIGAELPHILRRVSSTQVTLQQPLAATHTAEAFSITRAYNTLQSWENARDGDLVADDRTEIGVVYNDGPFTVGLEFKDSTTDATHRIWLTAPPGQRHDGRAGTGPRIRDADGGTFLILIRVPHVRVSGLELDCSTDSGYVSFGVDVRAKLTELDALLIYGGSFAALAFNHAGGTVVRNNLIWRMNQGTSGEPASIQLENWGGGNSGTVYAYNNTIHGSGQSGFGVYGAAETARFVAVNNVVVGSGVADYSGGESLYVNSSHNASSDGTAPGTQSIAVSETEFVSVTPGSEDLHLQSGAKCLDKGLTLPGFNDDVDGQPRPPGGWDLGGDERQ